MSDLDRELRDMLRSVHDDYVRRIEPQIPAVRQDLQRKVRRRRFTFAIGGAAVAATALVAALFVTQAAPPGRTPSPRPVAPASPDGSERRSCAAEVPFEIAGWSVGLGSGALVGIPLEDQDPKAILHFSRAGDAFVDVYAGDFPAANALSSSIQVLGQQGRLTPLGDTTAVEFAFQGCAYQLMFHGIAERDLRRFVNRLMPTGQAEGTGGFALWPEADPSAAYQACMQADTDRASAARVASSFARRVLDWRDAQTFSQKIGDGPERKLGQMSVLLTRDGAASEAELTVYEMARDCWSVVFARTPDDDAESYLSVSRHGSELTVGVDLDHEPYGDDVARIRLAAWNGDGSERAEASAFRKSYERMGYMQTGVPEGPLGFVLLLENEDLDVIGVIGQPLPASDFSAG